MIVIMLLTYERLEFAALTLRSVAENLHASEEIWLHIADDGSSQEYRDELFSLAHELFGDRCSMTNSSRNGYGGNYNKATQVVHGLADLVLPLEDDWKVVRDFDLDPLAGVLRDGLFDCVRLGYIGYTATLQGRLVYAEGLHWLEFDPDSSEKHVFAGGPRLETVAFERELGPWPENIGQGATELEVIGRPAARRKIAWPLDLVKPKGDLFVHIGSYKAGSKEPGSAVMEAK